MTQIELLVTGGPGSGATTTGTALAKKLQIPCFDTDAFFHKPTDPPFQKQYSKQERSSLLHESLSNSNSWILSGSICAWGITDIAFSHAVILNVGEQTRMGRLKLRERERFGERIDTGGDMNDEHIGFMHWASRYEAGDLEGRSLPVERRFLAVYCKHILEINEVLPLLELTDRVEGFLKEKPNISD